MEGGVEAVICRKVGDGEGTFELMLHLFENAWELKMAMGRPVTHALIWVI